VAVGLGFMGFIPLFGGIAGLLRRLIGGWALKRLVVAAVVPIVLGCSTFPRLVATHARR
jgi:hypothetical protein